MTSTLTLKILLLAGGTIATGIGAALLLAPVWFQASAGITLGPDPNLLSEMRAQGAVLLGTGAIILAGAFVQSLAFTATLLATVFFLAYGLARTLGVVLDGLPGSSLVAATGIELVIGALSFAALLRYREAA